MADVWVAEINGRGIAAFGPYDEDEARDWLNNPAFQSDLQVLETDGRSLWDGASEIFLREAFPDEQERWSASRAVAMRQGDGEDDWLIFLVAVTNPTDDEFDDDDDDDD